MSQASAGRGRRRRPAPTSALAKASSSSGATTGAASAFAGTVSSGSAWNWSQRIGAVASPHAVETATHRRELAGQRVALERRERAAARATKIATTAANESWKPGVEQVVRVPGEQDERAEQEEVPAVGRPRGEPRERDERAGDAGADDRRLRADGEHVRARSRRARRSGRASAASPSSHASASAPPATSTTFWPETASRW